MEEKLNYISNLVEEGYTSGFYPTRSIVIEEDEEAEDIRLQEVARLIREGYTNGFYPTWSLEIEEDDEQ